MALSPQAKAIGDKPAFPQLTIQLEDGRLWSTYDRGMTYRERLIGQALSNPAISGVNRFFAVQLTDHILEELAKETKQ